MKAQQTAVDVIANNMANTNTTGYKEQGARFSDLLHSSIQGTDNTGASGEILVGNGVAVATVQTDMAQGSPSGSAGARIWPPSRWGWP
jgi:flagellar hook protein FlgE